MEETKNTSNLLHADSMLNVKAQKEFLDYAYAKMFKTFLIMFPLIILLMLLVVGGVLYMLGLIRF